MSCERSWGTVRVVKAPGPDRELATSATLCALVAVEHPLPVDLLSGVHDGDGGDEDLPALLSRLEIEGLLEWNDDGTVRASDEATARTRLTGSRPTARPTRRSGRSGPTRREPTIFRAMALIV